jgi:hypothetical protein
MYYSVPGPGNAMAIIYLSTYLLYFLLIFLFLFPLSLCHPPDRIAFASVGFMLVISSHPDMPAIKSSCLVFPLFFSICIRVYTVHREFVL